tara:strand:- start:341 stop:736 length:396 start_codon:yes stop_codon:yes gene_type:complete
MKKKSRTAKIPISWGELIDKITILEIKKNKILALNAQKNIIKELKRLKLELKKNNNFLKISKNLKPKLLKINLKLWNAEDKIRIKEIKKEFDFEFIELARSIYKNNDKRSKLKSKINKFLNSDLKEEKSYQ